MNDFTIIARILATVRAYDGKPFNIAAVSPSALKTDKTTDRIRKEYEEDFSQWVKSGMRDEMPQVPCIGYPAVFKYDGKNIVECDQEETLKALDFVEEEYAIK